MITKARFFQDPSGVAADLRRRIWGLEECEVRVADRNMVILRLALRPWPPMRDEGYPVERVGILTLRDGSIYACPHGDENRPWKHRFRNHMKNLCLWDPQDPRGLRWTWDDGLESYITLVHRHLMSEEYARRHDAEWPAEDAPHGDGPHPIRSFAVFEAAESWSP